MYVYNKINIGKIFLAYNIIFIQSLSSISLLTSVCPK